MSARWPHTGAVLVGGASSRMGTPKGELVLPGGQKMVDAVIRTLEEVCAGVVTVGGSSKGLASVADLRSGAGPLGGIEALLASGLDEEYLVCPNDIPSMSSEMARRLTDHPEAMATAFETEGGRLQPLPIRISAAALPAVTAALDGGQNAIHRVLAGLETAGIPVTLDEARALQNVNTPGDFDAIT